MKTESCKEKGCLQGLFVWIFLILKAPHVQQNTECVTGRCHGQCFTKYSAQECVLDVHRELTMSLLWASWVSLGFFMSSWLSRVFHGNVLLVIFLCPSCFLGESAMTNSVLLNAVIKACGVKCGPAALTRLEFQTELSC